MRTSQFLALGLTLGLLACGPPPAPKKELPKPPPPGQLGEKCTPNQLALGQGTCAVGLVCTPEGGGFCTSLCPCGQGAACAQSTFAPDMCLKSCAADGDCKGAMTCNADWKVCAPEALLAPKPPVCSEAAPPRKVFGKVTEISEANRPAYEPSALLDKDNNVDLAYVLGIPIGPNNVATAKLTLGATDVTLGEKDKTLAIDSVNVLDPTLAKDRAGKLRMAYLGFTGGGVPSHSMVVGVVGSDDGGATWGKAVVASAKDDCPGDQPNCLDKPTIAIGPDRENPKNDLIYVFYWSAASKTLRVVHSADGGATFSAPSTRVGPGGYADADVSSSGKIHVVFASEAGNKMGDPQNGVFYTNSADGGATFAAPVRISPENAPVPFTFSSPRILVDVPRRLLYAVYTTGGPDGKWQIALAVSKDGGITWQSQTVNDDPACASHLTPAAALDPATGKVHVIWAENRAGTGAVAYASCATGGEKCGKNELVSETPFAAFGYGRHSAKGLGDYISLVVDAKHHLLHAFWTQPVGEGEAAVSHIFHSAAKLK